MGRRKWLASSSEFKYFLKSWLETGEKKKKKKTGLFTPVTSLIVTDITTEGPDTGVKSELDFLFQPRDM